MLIEWRDVGLAETDSVINQFKVVCSQGLVYNEWPQRICKHKIQLIFRTSFEDKCTGQATKTKK